MLYRVPRLVMLSWTRTGSPERASSTLVVPTTWPELGEPFEVKHNTLRRACNNGWRHVAWESSHPAMHPVLKTGGGSKGSWGSAPQLSAHGAFV